jgi:predicted nucleic acid-binding Zn ribbon protein
MRLLLVGSWFVVFAGSAESARAVTEFAPGSLSSDIIIAAECGNGIVEEGEQCEPPGTDTCDENCQEIVPEPECGNGIVEEGEQCEPPGTDTCDENCQEIAGVDLSGTWVVVVNTFGGLTTPVVGTTDVDIYLVMRLFIYKDAGDLVTDVEICDMQTTTTPDPNALVVTYTPEVLATMTATGSVPDYVVVPGDPIQLPNLEIRSGIDAAGDAVDDDADGNPGVTLPTVIGGFLSLEAYAGLVITTAIDATLQDENTIVGTTDFSAAGEVFSFSTPILPGGTISVVPGEVPAILVNRYDGELSCSEVLDLP